MESKATIKQSRGLRRIRYFSLALFVAGFLSSSAYALDPLGPPGSHLRKGQYSGGIDLVLSRQDLETSVGDWTVHMDGVLNNAGIAILGTLENFETRRAYANVGMNLAHNLDAFLRLGGTTAELDDEFWSEGEGFESHRELAIGGGIRKTFFEEIALKIGGVVQAGWYRFDGQLDASHWPAPHFLEFDLLEIQAALGATYMFSDRLSIYGGPFAQMIYGDLDYVYSTEDTGNLLTWRLHWDFEEDINYGAFFGTRIMIRQNCSVNIEYQQTGNGQAIGASLMLVR